MPKCPFCCKDFEKTPIGAKPATSTWWCPNYRLCEPHNRGACSSGTGCTDQYEVEGEHIYTHEDCSAKMRATGGAVAGWRQLPGYDKMTVCEACFPLSVELPPAVLLPGSFREVLPPKTCEAFCLTLTRHVAAVHEFEGGVYNAAQRANRRGQVSPYTDHGASTAAGERIFNSTPGEVSLIGMTPGQKMTQVEAMLDKTALPVNAHPQYGEGRNQAAVNDVVSEAANIDGAPDLPPRDLGLLKWAMPVAQCREEAGVINIDASRGVSARALETTPYASSQPQHCDDPPTDVGEGGPLHEAVLTAAQPATKLSAQGVVVSVATGCQIVINGKVTHGGAAGRVVTGDARGTRNEGAPAMQPQKHHGHVRIHFETQKRGTHAANGNQQQSTELAGGLYVYAETPVSVRRSGRKMAKAVAKKVAWEPQAHSFRP